MTIRRLYAPVVLLTLAAGGGAFFAASRVWAHTVIESEGVPAVTVAVTGRDMEPLVAALAVVSVTAALAILASGARVRQAVGVMMMVVAAISVWSIPLSGSSAAEAAVRQAVEDSPGFTGGNASGGIDYAGWDLVTVALFVVVCAMGALTAWFGRRWPTMGSRYETPVLRSAGESATLAEADMWKAMDKGEDPTE